MGATATAGELIVSIIGDMANLKKTFSEVQTEIGGFSKNISSMGKSLSSAGSSMTTGITAPIVAVGAGILGTLSVASDFDTQMRRTSTMLPGITQEGFKKISDQSIALSKQFGSDTTDINNAMYQALSSGIPEDNIFEFMQTSEKLAIGGATDVATSVDGLTSVVNSYGSSQISAAHAADVMFQGTKLGKSTIEELSKYMADVVPIAAANKISFEDVNASLATMTIQGTRTPVAITQLKNIILELSNDTTGAAQAFKQITGESFTDFIAKGGTVGEAIQKMDGAVGQVIPDVDSMNKFMKEFQDPASEMSQKFNELTGQSFQQFITGGGKVEDAMKLMGVESGKTTKSVSDFFSSVDAKTGVLQLSGEGAKIFSTNIQEMGKATGSTEEAYKTMADGIGTQSNIMKQDFKAFVIEAGNSFMPVFRDTIVPFVRDTLIPAFEKMIPVIVSIMTSFGQLSPTLQLIIIGLIGLIAAIGPVLMIIGAVASGIGAIAGLFAAGGALATAGTIISGLIAGIAALGAPILILIGVVALLAAAWANDWGGIREKAAAVWDWITTAAANLYNRLEYHYHAIEMAASTLRTNLGIIWDLLSAAFSTAINLIIGLVTGWYNNVKNNFNMIVAAGQALLNSWRAHWESIRNTLNDAVNFILNYLSNLYSKAQSYFNQIVAAAQSLLNSWRTHWESIRNTLNDAVNLIVNYLSNLYSKAQSYFNQIVAAAQYLLNEWRNRWTQIETRISDAKTAIYNKLQDIKTDAEKKAGEISDSIMKPLSEIKTKIENLFSDIKTAGKNLVQNLIDGINEKIDDLKTAVGKVTSAAADYLPMHSPSKVGALSTLPHWEDFFEIPIRANLEKTRGTLEAGLSELTGTITRIQNSNYSGAVSSVTYEGSQISIGPNHLSNQLDIQALIDEINRRVTAQRRARGYIL